MEGLRRRLEASRSVCVCVTQQFKQKLLHYALDASGKQRLVEVCGTILLDGSQKSMAAHWW